MQRGGETGGTLKVVPATLEPQPRWLNLHVASEEAAHMILASGPQKPPCTGNGQQ